MRASTVQSSLDHTRAPNNPFNPIAAKTRLRVNGTLYGSKSMTIVPTHKSDLNACEALAECSDTEVAAHIRDLLVWTQDINWPVARHVVNRLRRIEAPLIEPVREVLGGSDDVWKYFLVSSLLPVATESVRESLRPDLVRILQSPSSSEVSEGVVEAIRGVLSDAAV